MSPLAPLGIEAALKAKEDPSFVPRPKIFDEFALTDRVGLVSGGNRGLGLETAIALAEAGARVVYCFDLAEEPSEEFKASGEYVGRLGNGSRLEYFSADVRNQELLWKKAEEIGDKEQRFDFCVAAAGILKPEIGCLEYPAQEFRDVSGMIGLGTLLIYGGAGGGGEHDGCAIHGTGSRTTDGAIWAWGQHYPDCVHVRKYYEQGEQRRRL